jgi:hypothetical protein
MATRLFHSTPPKPTPRGYNQYSAKPAPLAKTRKEQLRENMHGYFLGPMDPASSCAFMPINSQNLGGPPDGIDFRQVYDQPNERSMYAPVCKALRYSLTLTTVLTHIEPHRWLSRTKCVPTMWRSSPGIG